MTQNAQITAMPDSTHLKDFIELCKPRVVALMILTALVGMFLASTNALPWHILIFGNLGITLMACAGAVMNHLLEYRTDVLMQRTQRRPIVRGKIAPKQALIFALTLCVLGFIILIIGVNAVTALLTLFTFIGYAGIYTLYLKRATPQNIVIGGLAGAMPPLLGWVAVTGHIEAGGLLLTLIIFIWTPPHFWALAIHRRDDYAKANIPMLPVTHGIRYTKINVLLYTLLLAGVTCLPFAIGMSGWIYLVITILLNLRFIYLAIVLLKQENSAIAYATFRYSIIYLMGLFVALLVDHYIFL